MNTYNITFYGRLRGAIGIQYTIYDTVTSENAASAILKLYDKYENVSFPIATDAATGIQYNRDGERIN